MEPVPNANAVVTENHVTTKLESVHALPRVSPAINVTWLVSTFLYSDCMSVFGFWDHPL